MESSPDEFVTLVMRDFDVAYTYFLVQCGVLDTPIAKAAFYAVCEKIVRDDPFPLTAVQKAIQNHLCQVRDGANEELAGLVRQIFEDVVKANITT